MFDFGNANSGQRKAISTVDGPVLITAGPGTGKTYTLVQRAIFLIEERAVLPEQILIATFTEKAAKELVTRITNELATRKIPANVNEMYIGTFHSLCLRIIKENLVFTRLKRNYRLLDSFDQKYLVFRNFHKFKSIDGIDSLLQHGGAWQRAEEICAYVNILAEEFVDTDKMSGDPDPRVAALSKGFGVYKELLEEDNLIDFASIQTECFRLLRQNVEILQALREKIRYIMIDEYQDTNYIQEQLVFLLGEKHQNICVVGDDDQGLYRFRGATIRNILEFPSKFRKGACKIIPLVVNYRSDSKIVDFYNKWMSTTDGADFKFSWGGFRYSKCIEPHALSNIKSPCVVKLTGYNNEDVWHENVLGFINRLKDSGTLTDYNQLAFLFNSVKHQRVTSLADFLEENGINVYSPRSDMFFSRNEIKFALGCLLLMLPKYVVALENGEHRYLKKEHYDYYRDCIAHTNNHLKQPGNKELRRFIKQHGKAHCSLAGTTDYAYSGLLYRLFMFEPFCSILSSDLDAGVVDIRPARNLALLTQIIGKYEYLHHVDVLNEKFIDSDTERLFNLYLRLLYDGGISEYEDDAEYAPSGCVSFLTIHQSKGMEFPIVLVDSLRNVPRKNYKDLMLTLEEKYFHRPAFEPADQTKFFDFWRLYYTAFSRAQDLLVLTCNEDSRTPSKYFEEVYNDLPNTDNATLDLSEFNLHAVKTVNLKATFSFTSHISVYETCALQYKFYKELEFSPIRESAMLFGSLVHETIEDIHRAILNKDEDLVTAENIAQWFEGNYSSLTQTEHTYLASPQKQAALQQVLRYADHQRGNWHVIKQAEVEVSLVQPDYIIAGKIDLIKGEGDTVELVDFKSERKPDMERDRDRLERYRRQLHLYAYLVEQRTGQKVSRMHLYYTGEENGNPTVTFPYTKSAIEGTVASFDDTAQKILRRDFRHCSTNPKVCENCDFRYYCQNR